MRARTTLQDYGRGSEEHGQIPFFNVYPYRFYVNEHHVMPDDVFTWCRANCHGFYRVVCYTHRSSRDNKPVIYIDKVYLSDDKDAELLKLHLSVTALTVRRPEKLTKAKVAHQKGKMISDPVSKEAHKSESGSAAALSRRAKAAWATRRANGWVHPKKRKPLLRLTHSNPGKDGGANHHG